jgi:hypothetical protein
MRLVHGFVANLAVLNIEALAQYDGRKAGVSSSLSVRRRTSRVAPSANLLDSANQACRLHGGPREYSDGRMPGDKAAGGRRILWRPLGSLDSRSIARGHVGGHRVDV